jgi:SpoVK/Ycf46/Vps4 family AAA+-type ATPase
VLYKLHFVPMSDMHFVIVRTENELEKRLFTDVIPPYEFGVTFEDIGALENVKETLKELVMLPLQRLELFTKGQLMKVLTILQASGVIWSIFLSMLLG